MRARSNQRGNPINPISSNHLSFGGNWEHNQGYLSTLKLPSFDIMASSSALSSSNDVKVLVRQVCNLCCKCKRRLQLFNPPPPTSPPPLLLLLLLLLFLLLLHLHILGNFVSSPRALYAQNQAGNFLRWIISPAPVHCSVAIIANG